MKRLTRFQENISVRKATNYAIIINSLEILLILGVMALVVISPQYDFSPRMVRLASAHSGRNGTANSLNLSSHKRSDLRSGSSYCCRRRYPHG